MRMKPSSRLAKLCSVAVIALPQATYAQSTPVEPTVLDRIVLGAGADKVATDTPQAVTVLNQSDLDQAQATTPAELFDLVPGVQPIGSERVAGLSFNIRGIGSLAASDESKIIITIDGATKFYEQYRVGSFFSDPELFKRVEVLRGPASSTLYGAGAMGGVINFETKDASDFLTDKDWALRTKLSYDSNGKGKLASAIWAQRYSEAFETLFALNHRRADNYKDGNGKEIVGSEFTANSALLKGTWHLGDDLEQTLKASFTQWSNNADDTQYSQTGTSGFGTINRDIKDQTFSLAYNNPFLDHPGSDLDVVFSYSNTEIAQSDSSVGSSSPLFLDSEYGYKTLSLKLENTSEMSAADWQNYLTYGVQISRQDRTATNTRGGFGFHPEGRETKLALYAQGEFIWNERLSIFPGLRFEQVRQKTTGATAQAPDVSQDSISPKLALHYKLNDSWSIFGSIAQLERTATLDERFSNSLAGQTRSGQFRAARRASINLEPEKSRNIELGVSFAQSDVFTDADRISFKATAFQNKIDNLIATTPRPLYDTPALANANPVAYYRNVDKARISGVEIEGAYESDIVFGRLAYSDVHGEDETTGETLSSTPARNLALTLGGKNDQMGLRYGWSGHFYDKITTTAGSFDSYTTHDLFVSWTPDRGALRGFETRLSVENIGDTFFENNLAGDPGRGRTWKFSIAKTF